MACPMCAGVALEHRVALRIPRAQCSRCAGAFFDRSQLMKLAAELEMNLEPLLGRGSDAHRGGACPLCMTPMFLMVIYPPPETGFGSTTVELETCPTHGVWFGDGEIEDALELIAAGGFVGDG